VDGSGRTDDGGEFISENRSERVENNLNKVTCI